MINISSIKHLAYLLKCKTTEKELLEICLELQSKNHENDKRYYKEWTKDTLYPNGKLKRRKINPSLGRLKTIQRQINKCILSTIDLPDYIQGGIKGRSNITNAAQHIGNKFKFTTDIKKFYPSITNKRVYQALTRVGIKPEIARVITLLGTYKGRLPQGAHTSTALANVAFLIIDENIKVFCNQHNISYTRYIDDLSSSSKNDFKQMLPTLISFITQDEFSISSRKTQYKHVLDITGIKVKNNGMKPNEKFLEKLISPEQSKLAKLGRENYLNRVTTARKKDSLSPKMSPKK